MFEEAWNSLPPFSKSLYQDTYFLPGQDFESWIKAVTTKFATDDAHATRMQKYIAKKWLHPSTPISSQRGLPIACYVSHVEDNNESIFDSFQEGMFLGAGGGGRGVYWGDVAGSGRPIGTYPKHYSWAEIQEDSTIPKSSGTVPFLGVSDRATYSISQANVRRSTEAVYIPINHPDILDVIDIRLETGDPNRRMPNLHHGIAISDDFMHAVESLQSWDLICPHTGKVTATIDAFDLWMDILVIRKTEAGEPYLLFIDTVNKDNPIEYTLEGYLVYSSNICTEIVGATAPDMTSVCCLASLNLEQYDEFKDSIDEVISDLSVYLSNVLKYTYETTLGYKSEIKRNAFKRVRKFIEETMEIGIGVMGWHSLLQRNTIPFESPMAAALNRTVMTSIKSAVDKHQASIPLEDRCLLSKKHGTHKANLHSIAIAPTMSIATLSGLTSSGVEPWVSNAFTKKVPTGSFAIRNKYLDEYILKESKIVEMNIDTVISNEWYEQQWDSIIKSGGSVQHLEWMPDYIKDVYKTAFEIDQRAVISLAADRQKIMVNEQSQSINVFLPAEVSYEELHTVHFMAWKEGLKSLYYLRSQPATQAQTGDRARREIVLEDDACVFCT